MKSFELLRRKESGETIGGHGLEGQGGGRGRSARGGSSFQMPGGTAFCCQGGGRGGD